MEASSRRPSTNPRGRARSTSSRPTPRQRPTSTTAGSRGSPRPRPTAPTSRPTARRPPHRATPTRCPAALSCCPTHRRPLCSWHPARPTGSLHRRRRPLPTCRLTARPQHWRPTAHQPRTHLSTSEARTRRQCGQAVMATHIPCLATHSSSPAAGRARMVQTTRQS
jgi:hypothetical protein